MRHEDLRERRLVIEHAHDGRFLEPHDRAFRGIALTVERLLRLSGQAALTAELLRGPDCDDRLFPLPGNDSDFELALLDVEHGVRGIALLEDSLILAILGYGSALADLGEKTLWIERRLSGGHNRHPIRRRRWLAWRGLNRRGRPCALYIYCGAFSSTPAALRSSNVARRKRRGVLRGCGRPQPGDLRRQRRGPERPSSADICVAQPEMGQRGQA